MNTFEMGISKNLRRPRIEPGSPAWQADIIPLDQRRLLKTQVQRFQAGFQKLIHPKQSLRILDVLLKVETTHIKAFKNTRSNLVDRICTQARID